jgi:hypothetical protein
VVQASKYGSTFAQSVANQGSRKGALQREAPMGAVEVVVLGELDEDGPQMSLADDDQVIKAPTADRANERLGDGIRRGARSVG